MHNDLNFFAISKSGSGKGSGGMSILLPVLFFLLIIGGAYGYITYAKMDTQSKIDGISKQLLEKQYVDANKIILSMGSKNDFLNKYNNNIILASDKFKKSIFINSDLYKKILSAFPAGVNYSKINITDNKVTLDCTAPSTLSPAKFAENLVANKLFADVVYSGISKSVTDKNAPANSYSFSIAFTII